MTIQTVPDASSSLVTLVTLVTSVTKKDTCQHNSLEEEGLEEIIKLYKLPFAREMLMFLREGTIFFTIDVTKKQKVN